MGLLNYIRIKLKRQPRPELPAPAKNRNRVKAGLAFGAGGTRGFAHIGVIRALEVYRETGKTMSRHNADTRLVPPRYEPVYLGLAYADREEMKRIIDLRVDRMVAQGLFDEVRALVESGVPRTATAMQAIGYKECLGCLAGECTQDEAVAEIKLRSRQYAKRQLTWLRRNKDIHWFYRKNSRDLPAALQFSTEILTNLGVS